MQLLGPLCLGAASAIWGGMYVVSKYVLVYIPPLTLVTIRMVIAAAVLGALVLYAKTAAVRREHLKDVAVLGLVGFTVSIGCQFIGTHLASASLGSIITSASPSFIVLFSWLLHRETVVASQVWGLIFSTAGVLFIGVQQNGGMQADFAGIVFLTIAAVTWALYTVLAKGMSAIYSPLTITCYASFFGAVFTAPFALWELQGASVIVMEWKVIAGILYLGIISTALAFYLWNKGFTLVSAGTGAVYFFLQPVFGMLLGMTLLGEAISVATAIGSIIILLGVACGTLGVPKQQ